MRISYIDLGEYKIEISHNGETGYLLVTVLDELEDEIENIEVENDDDEDDGDDD